MILNQHPDVEDAILITNPEPLKVINIGILNKNGSVDQVVTFEELARVGNSQTVNMHNYGRFGEVECEFTISDADNVSNKVAYLREQQEKQQGGNIIDG